MADGRPRSRRSAAAAGSAASSPTLRRRTPPADIPGVSISDRIVPAPPAADHDERPRGATPRRVPASRTITVTTKVSTTTVPPSARAFVDLHDAAAGSGAPDAAIHRHERRRDASEQRELSRRLGAAYDADTRSQDLLGSVRRRPRRRDPAWSRPRPPRGRQDHLRRRAAAPTPAVERALLRGCARAATTPTPIRAGRDRGQHFDLLAELGARDQALLSTTRRHAAVAAQASASWCGASSAGASSRTATAPITARKGRCS